MESRSSHWVSCTIIHCFFFLSQCLSLNLELGWQPASHSDPPVAANPVLYPSAIIPGTVYVFQWPCLAFYVDARDANTGPHAYAGIPTHRPIFVVIFDVTEMLPNRQLTSRLELVDRKKLVCF